MNEFDFNTTTTDPAVTQNVFANMGTGTAILSLALVVLLVVSMWKIFEKAGRPGWAAIVPFYNVYILVQIVGRSMNFFWAYLALVIVSMIPIVGLITSIGLIVISIILTLDLAKSFGKTTGFAVLMILLPIVGYPMLAFGKDKYVGPAVATATPETKTPETPDTPVTPV
jgi:hypothetical protein